MRLLASLNLFYLFFLAVSVFSSLHVDHPGSHAQICVANKITAECHSEMPHSHEKSHPGEDSLLEHAFEDGASLDKAFLPLYAIEHTIGKIVTDTTVITEPLLEATTARWYSALDTPPISRGPPTPSKKA
ncbi:MAG TPA: hypothetical protein PLY93_01105 [Turneriella sp.]|nr:hypothetical protein [Turneriella sp.]